MHGPGESSCMGQQSRGRPDLCSTLNQPGEFPSLNEIVKQLELSPFDLIHEWPARKQSGGVQ